MGGIVKGAGDVFRSTIGSGGVKGFAGNLLGSQLESLGLKRPDAQEVDPQAFSELYNQAMEEMRGVGQDAASKANRKKVEESLGGMLGELENNSAARKQNYMEDMARGFQADTQSLARARGGTGSLQQALRPSGQMYDAQARAQSRGLVDLYGQGVQDLSSLQGVQGNLQGQDLSRAQGIGNLATKELDSRRGQLNTNADSRWQANQAQNAAIGKTREQAMKMAGMAAKGGAG
jgi:hypothetical protein